MNEIGVGMNDIEAASWLGARLGEPQQTSDNIAYFAANAAGEELQKFRHETA